MIRCINIDWLEIFCLEDISKSISANYFRQHNYTVIEREYGTPIYKEMFTIAIAGSAFIEVRRNPYSKKGQGGVLAANSTHLRLVNEQCYSEHPIELVKAFCLQHGYLIKGISRIDICLDFRKFDNGMIPNNFVKKYMANIISKLNQSRVAAHGKDTFNERLWNSLSWGSEKSMIRTKIYNKTLEMREVALKPYIMQQWYVCGLIDSIALPDYDIWRIEFSIKSEAKQWVSVEDCSHEEIRYKSLHNTLDCYSSKDRQLIIFRSLMAHYFHFKINEFNKDGTSKRKDRCKDVELFNFKASDELYKPKRFTKVHFPTRTDKILIKRCKEIELDTSKELWQRKSAHNLIAILANDIFEMEQLNREYQHNNITQEDNQLMTFFNEPY